MKKPREDLYTQEELLRELHVFGKSLLNKCLPVAFDVLHDKLNEEYQFAHDGNSKEIQMSVHKVFADVTSMMVDNAITGMKNDCVDLHRHNKKEKIAKEDIFINGADAKDDKHSI